MKLWVFFLLFTLGSPALAFDSKHELWGKVLNQFVSVDGAGTRVKYAALKKDRANLDQYLKDVSSVTLKDFNSWTEPTKLAFLFNAYNAFTVQLIIDGMGAKPNMKSIKDLGGLFSSPWKKQFFSFLGEPSTLDHIEQDLARPNYDEPRMHMAFNCASLGCPALVTKPFVADTLDAQLEQAAQNFLQDANKNIYDANAKVLHLSSIFKWYGEDFKNSKKFGPLNEFLAKRLKVDEVQRKLIREGKVKIDFLDYDWKLNIQK